MDNCDKWKLNRRLQWLIKVINVIVLMLTRSSISFLLHGFFLCFGHALC